MSHFTRIKTQMVEKDFLTQALADLGYRYEVGDAKIRGFLGRRTEVEIKVFTPSRGYDIGFRRAGKAAGTSTVPAYEIVADWWGIRDINQKQFVQQLYQRYAYHAARAKLEQQGFTLVSEDVREGNQIHLVLRRTV